jgi:hypothetical protein
MGENQASLTAASLLVPVIASGVELEKFFTSSTRVWNQQRVARAAAVRRDGAPHRLIAKLPT